MGGRASSPLAASFEPNIDITQRDEFCDVIQRARNGSPTVRRLQPADRSDPARIGGYEIRVDANANMEAGPFRTGSHDDLVTAVGLACLIDPTGRRIRTGPNVVWG